MARLPKITQRFNVRWVWSFAVISVSFAFVLVLSVLAQVDRSTLTATSQRSQEQSERTFRDALRLAGAPIAAVVSVLAQEPELDRAVAMPSSSRDALRTMMEDNSVHAVWVFDANGRQVGARRLLGNGALATFPVSGGELRALFNDSRTTVFFAPQADALIEYHGARRAGGQGFVFAARSWADAPPSATVEAVGFRVITGLAKPSSVGNHGFPTILKGAGAEEVLPVWVAAAADADLAIDSTARTTLVAGAFAVLLLWILHLLSKWTLIRPLSILDESLKRGKTRDLELLARSRTEFAPLAQAIGRSFDQQEELKREVADKARTQEALERAKERAETATRLKGEFVANISHEIRTPLSSMIGIIDLLNETRLDEEQQEFVGILSSSARNLRSIINDVLDYSKMESGNMRFEKIPFDLTRLLTELGQLHRVSAQEKGVQFLVEIDPLVPNTLIGDPVRIQQVLNNLVSNAIKFTAEGSIKVAVQLVSETEDSATVRFSVIDTGIGVPVERQAAIFQSFTQADGSMTRIYGGTGLGLTICRTIVEMMGGQIGLKSREGHGSTFWFEVTLPKQAQKEFLDASTILLPESPRQG